MDCEMGQPRERSLADGPRKAVESLRACSCSMLHAGMVLWGTLVSDGPPPVTGGAELRGRTCAVGL